MRSNEGPKIRFKPGSKDNSTDRSRAIRSRSRAWATGRLGDFLCFAIYSANLAFGRAYRKGLEDLGLTYPQWIAIVALGEQDDQTVSELGERMSPGIQHADADPEKARDAWVICAANAIPRTNGRCASA